MRHIGMLKIPARKARTVCDRIYTWLEIKELGQHLRSTHMAFAERLVMQDVYPFLHQEDMVVYDIGAYIGSFTRAAASLRNIRMVYAFEPVYENFQQLKARTGEFSHVQCFNVAIGNSTGAVTMYESAFSPSSSLLPMGRLHKEEFPKTGYIKERVVQVVCLDDLVSQQQLLPPDFVKIDVQGFEDRVLEGGLRTLRRARHCMLEMSFYPLYEGALVFDNMYMLMRQEGFKLVGITGGVFGRSGRLLQVDGVFEREHQP